MNRTNIPWDVGIHMRTAMLTFCVDEKQRKQPGQRGRVSRDTEAGTGGGCGGALSLSMSMTWYDTTRDSGSRNSLQQTSRLRVSEEVCFWEQSAESLMWMAGAPLITTCESIAPAR